MSSPAGVLERFVAWQEKIPSTAAHIVAAILFVSIVRLGLETLPNPAIHILIAMLRSVTLLSFYAGSFFLFLFAASLFFKGESFARMRSIIMLSIFAGIAPPFITLFISLFWPQAASGEYGYFETFSWNFFSATQPMGEGIGIWLGILAVGAYVGYRKSSFVYGVVGAAAFYVVAQFSGWFLNIVSTSLSGTLSPLKPDTPFFPLFSMDLVWVFISISAYIWIRRAYFAATLRRFHYTIVRGAVILLGAWIAGAVTAFSMVEAAVLIAAAMLVQAENDYYDKSADEASGRASTLTADDMIFVRFFMVLLVLPFMTVQPLFALLLGFCFMLGFAYNHPLFRLKKHFITASFVQAGGTFACLLAGILSITWNSVSATQLAYAAVLSILFGIFSNLKDYKDFAADKSAGVVTLHVWLYTRFDIPPAKTQWVLAGFLSGTALVAGIALLVVRNF